MSHAGFAGLRVLTLESRRAKEIEKLIEKRDGKALVAPSVREVVEQSNREAFDFVHALEEQRVDVVLFMTGVGVRALVSSVINVCSAERLAVLLNSTAVVARGPKPSGALRELGVKVALLVPEPNTWRDLISVLDDHMDVYPLRERTIAVQEYGVANRELYLELEARGAKVMPVHVYGWSLPEDLTPLQNAIDAVIAGQVDVLLVASSVQIRHLLQVAESMEKTQALRGALASVVIASIGPLTSEELRNCGLHVDIESNPPKMGILVKEAAEHAGELLARKRSTMENRQ